MTPAQMARGGAAVWTAASLLILWLYLRPFSQWSALVLGVNMLGGLCVSFAPFIAVSCYQAKKMFWYRFAVIVLVCFYFGMVVYVAMLTRGMFNAIEGLSVARMGEGLRISMQFVPILLPLAAVIAGVWNWLASLKKKN